VAAANLSNRRWGVRVRTLGGRYRLETPLGKGGMAVVWRARDLVLGRQVAVKLLAPTLGDRLSRERIRAEAQVAARLAHPNVASVYDFGESRRRPRGRVPYIVMELVDGDTLATRQQGDRLHWRTAVCIAAEVAAALAAAHACGVVHRDVKPGNILLGADGAPRLSDFGLARVVDAARVTTTGVIQGTPAYIAPEQVRGEAVGPAADVYALGLVLLEALTGRREYDGPPIEAALARLFRDPKVPGDLSGGVAEVLPRMVMRDPRARPGAAEVADGLRMCSAAAAA